MGKLRIECECGQIGLEKNDKTIEFWFDGGDGTNRLDQEQIKKVYDFLRNHFELISSDKNALK